MSDRVVWAFLSGIVLVGLLDPNQIGPSIDFMRKALMGMAPFYAIVVTFAAFAKTSGLNHTLARVFTGQPLAALAGIPAYMNGFAAVPLVGGLLQMGMSPGAGLAFMTAGAVSSIPAALAVYPLVRRSVFMLYILLGFIGSVMAGLGIHLICLNQRRIQPIGSGFPTRYALFVKDSISTWKNQ